MMVAITNSHFPISLLFSSIRPSKNLSREREEMKTSPSIIIPLLLLIWGMLFSQAFSQTDSCSSNLNLKTPIVFDTKTLQCRPVWAGQDFILRYAQAGPKLWSFVLSAPAANSYLGIGFSPSGSMVGSNAVVGWISSDGISGLKRYSLEGQTPNQVVPDKGDLPVLSNSTAVVVESSRMYLAFQLNTDMPLSRIIYSVGPPGVFPSAPSYRLTEHANKVATSINYVTGQSQTEKTPYSRLRKTHGILNMLGWGILMPIGAIVARYFKSWDPMWFYAHASIQSTAFILGISGVVCGFILKDKTNAINVNKHKGIGIFVLVLGCLQVMAVLARPDKESKYRKYWNWYHYTVGRVLVFFAAVNVFYGINLANAGTAWTASFAVIIVGIFVISAGLEFRMWKRRSN